MKKHGILNSEISKVISDTGHTDQITICDVGLPIPANIKKIDISLTTGIPSFIDVLKATLDDFQIEKVVLAEEIQNENKSQLANIKQEIPNVEIMFVSHEEFKDMTRNSKAVIRTGEATPYSNIILQSGVVF